MDSISKTCIAPVNIAVIKYWGKSDEENIIPLNDSISITLDMNYMYTRTTAIASPDFTEDHIIINNQGAAEGGRFSNCLREIRLLASKSKNSKTVEVSQWKVNITSVNNFPTKAGLASSASGFACLVFTLSQLYGLDASSSELSALARHGSGSACRSLFGGFVQWEKAGLSISRPIADADYWPELHCLIAVVSTQSKAVGSTEGMRRSVRTSTLLQHRIENVLQNRVPRMKEAILSRNFQEFAELCMKDSNQFHAICLDTYPPLFYMDSTSHSIIEFVHRYNKFYDEIKVAYTFDAGPNAVLLMLREDIGTFASVFHLTFGGSSSEEFFKGLPFKLNEIPDELVNSLYTGDQRGKVQHVICCSIGQGPKIVN